MSAIAPPPVGSDRSVIADNASALAALRQSREPASVAEPTPEPWGSLTSAPSLLALIAFGVATLAGAALRARFARALPRG